MNLEISDREKEILKHVLIYHYIILDQAYLRKECKLDRDFHICSLEEHYGSLDELDFLMNKLLKKE